MGSGAMFSVPWQAPQTPANPQLRVSRAMGYSEIWIFGQVVQGVDVVRAGEYCCASFHFFNFAINGSKPIQHFAPYGWKCEFARVKKKIMLLKT